MQYLVQHVQPLMYTASVNDDGQARTRAGLISMDTGAFLQPTGSHASAMDPRIFPMMVGGIRPPYALYHKLALAIRIVLSTLDEHMVLVQPGCCGHTDSGDSFALDSVLPYWVLARRYNVSYSRTILLTRECSVGWPSYRVE